MHKSRVLRTQVYFSMARLDCPALYHRMLAVCVPDAESEELEAHCAMLPKVALVVLSEFQEELHLQLVYSVAWEVKMVNLQLEQEYYHV